jgi:hypothetical protein
LKDGNPWSRAESGSGVERPTVDRFLRTGDVAPIIRKANPKAGKEIAAVMANRFSPESSGANQSLERLIDQIAGEFELAQVRQAPPNAAPRQSFVPSGSW